MAKNKATRRPTRKSKELVLGHLESVSSKVFEKYAKEITELAGRRHGVYALYKGKSLYYVGLATNLKGRVNHHLRDKHAGKWDRFSLYLVRQSDHIRELEALILRIADPKGNAQKGRLPGSENLKKGLERKLRAATDREISGLLGHTGTFVRSKKKPSKKKPVARKGMEPSLAGYFKKRTQIRAPYKGKIYKAYVLKSGKVSCGGKHFNSPSMAAIKILQRRANGWNFWRYKNSLGEWVKLDKLRK